MTALSGSNSKDLKIQNKALVLKLIATSKKITRSELVRMTGLSKMTVSNIVAELISDDIVTEVCANAQDLATTVSSGRKSSIVLISAKSPCIVGILVKRKLCQFIIGDLGGNILKEIHKEYETLASTQNLIDMLKNGYSAITNGWTRKLVAIGIGSVGPVDSSNKIILNTPDFWGVSNVPIGSILEEFTGLPAFLFNDANAGALAENLYGKCKDLENFLYLHLMNGIGAGIIIGNTLYEGDNGLTGEIGHTSINFAGPLCSCGNRGCVELYANLSRMQSRICELSPLYPNSPLASCVSASWLEIVNYADSGDSIALCVLDEFCTYISYAIVNTLNLLNLKNIIIGYDSRQNGGAIEKMVRAKLSGSMEASNFNDIRVMHSSFHGSAPLIGCIAYVANMIFMGKFSISTCEDNAKI